ncbi:unnamed protein product [Dovyalis caffra]|uniref:Uncharacterized protein n=1 Tax=Dovyalis caffra TaxID=77055 RepID=A0AAV1RSK1_9ROSI|nr:unnamed protein product [Dovyalis caffra]
MKAKNNQPEKRARLVTRLGSEQLIPRMIILLVTTMVALIMRQTSGYGNYGNPYGSSTETHHSRTNDRQPKKDLKKDISFDLKKLREFLGLPFSEKEENKGFVHGLKTSPEDHKEGCCVIPCDGIDRFGKARR